MPTKSRTRQQYKFFRREFKKWRAGYLHHNPTAFKITKGRITLYVGKKDIATYITDPSYENYMRYQFRKLKEL